MKSSFSGKDLVENYTDREDVRTMIKALCSYLLRRHVPDGSHDRSRIGVDLARRYICLCFRVERRLSELCQSEVQDFDATLIGDENVFGLEISMDDPFLVSRRQSVCDLQSVVDGLPGG